MRITYSRWIAVVAAHLALPMIGAGVANAALDAEIPIHAKEAIQIAVVSTGPLGVGEVVDNQKVIETASNRTRKRRLKTAEPQRLLKQRATRNQATSTRNIGGADCSTAQGTTSKPFGQGDTLVSVEATPQSATGRAC